MIVPDWRWRRRRQLGLDVAHHKDNPRHVGIIMDGNRRWARALGRSASFGHDAGANHLGDVLGWLRARRIEHASVYVLSADNIRKRSAEEVDYLFSLMESVLAKTVEQSHDWQLHVSGDLTLLSPRARRALEQVVRQTHERPCHLTLAIGYSPHDDIVTGIRSALEQGVDADTPELVQAIGAHMPGGPLKEIDLVIRTSGETRTSGFFPWQTTRAEIVLSNTMWPAFSESDLDRALAEYRDRRRRLAAAL